MDRNLDPKKASLEEIYWRWRIFLFESVKLYCVEQMYITNS